MAELARIIYFGVGGAAHRAAIRQADQLRATGLAARALFKPEHGGWVIVINGRIRGKPS